MGLLDFLSPALTVGTEAAGAQQQAQLQSALMKRQQEIQAILLEKQLQMQGAQIQHLGAQDTHMANQDNPTVRGNIAGAEAVATGAKAKNEADVTHLQNEDNPTVQGNLAHARAQGEVGPHVQQATETFNQNLPGQEQLARIRALSNPMAQTQLTRLSQAAGQAHDADTGMRAYEQKILSGQVQIDGPSMIAARAMLSGGPVQATAAEAILNKSNPDLAEYIRNAKAMSTVERMIMPRGGSNYMSQAEQALSGVGTGAGANLVHQAQKYRSRILESLDRESMLGVGPSLPFPSAQDSLGGSTGKPNFFMTP